MRIRFEMWTRSQPLESDVAVRTYILPGARVQPCVSSSLSLGFLIYSGMPTLSCGFQFTSHCKPSEMKAVLLLSLFITSTATVAAPFLCELGHMSNAIRTSRIGSPSSGFSFGPNIQLMSDRCWNVNIFSAHSLLFVEFHPKPQVALEVFIWTFAWDHIFPF